MPTRSETPTPPSKRSTRQPTQTAAANDALTLLEHDHRLVEALFNEFQSATEIKRKKQIAKRICNELTVHAMLEESSFYPQARRALGEDADLVDQAKVEHSSLKLLIAQIEDETPEAELYDAKIKVLQAYVQHHVHEEENMMFPKLRSTRLDLVKLGATMQAVKQELQKSFARH